MTSRWGVAPERPIDAGREASTCARRRCSAAFGTVCCCRRPHVARTSGRAGHTGGRLWRANPGPSTALCLSPWAMIARLVGRRVNRVGESQRMSTLWTGCGHDAATARNLIAFRKPSAEHQPVVATCSVVSPAGGGARPQREATRGAETGGVDARATPCLPADGNPSGHSSQRWAG